MIKIFRYFLPKYIEILLLQISFKALTVGESGISVRKFFPSSQHLANNGSKGIEPKNSTFNSFDIVRAPPDEAGNISVVFCIQIYLIIHIHPSFCFVLLNHSYLAFRTYENTHVFNHTQNWNIHFSAKVYFLPDI